MPVDPDGYFSLGRFCVSWLAIWITSTRPSASFTINYPWLFADLAPANHLECPLLELRAISRRYHARIVSGLAI